jgi:peroxiredoxin
MSNPAASRPAADRSQWTNLIVLSVIVLLVVVVFHYRPFGSPHPTDHLAVGRPLPVLEIEPLTGGARPVNRDGLKGKVVLLDLWAASYTPCREELPYLAAIANEFQEEKDFKLLAISCGELGPDNFQTVRRRTEKVLKELDLDLPTYADPTGATEDSFRAVANYSNPPTTYVVDRRGTIRGVWEGFRPGIEGEMKELVEQLLEEPK